MRCPSYVAAVLLGLVSTGVAQAGEDYFVLMFGSQQVPSDPRYSHSFATFVRVSWAGDGPCPPAPIVESHTISWLACSMVVRVNALRPECGKNFDLHTTLRWSQANDMRTSLWGPYRICPELYYRSLKEFALVESDQLRYKAVDSGYPTDRVSNCIHVLADVVNGPRLRIASPGWGETASYIILRQYRNYLVQPEIAHPWVSSALGLDQYPLIYRDFERPRSGAIGGPIYRLLGGERDLQATYGPPLR